MDDPVGCERRLGGQHLRVMWHAHCSFSSALEVEFACPGPVPTTTDKRHLIVTEPEKLGAMWGPKYQAPDGSWAVALHQSEGMLYGYTIYKEDGSFYEVQIPTLHDPATLSHAFFDDRLELQLRLSADETTVLTIPI